MFAITSASAQESCAARAGALTTPQGVIETPGWLVYTRRGSPLHLTPDLLAGLAPQGVQVDVLHFLKQPEPAVVEGFPGSGREFLGLPATGCVVVAGARDPTTYEYSGALRQSTDAAVSVVTHNGGATVTPAQYMAATGALQPDVVVALSDEVPSGDTKRERAVTSVNRSIAWLQECLRLRAADARLQAAALFACIQGAQFVGERERCAEAMAAEPGVAGFVIGGLGTGESPKARAELLQGVVQRLPADRPRMVPGLGTPEEVLEAVAQGVDLFDMGFLTEVTLGGYALSFPLSPDEDEAGQGGAVAAVAAPATAAAAEVSSAAEAAARGSEAGCRGSAGGDDTKLNLLALEYRTDSRALVPRCGCFTCRNHTRAYLHHLLHTHEMTAQVLLEVHNTHHYQRWFAEVRRAVAAGRLAEYADWFLARRQRATMG